MKSTESVQMEYALALFDLCEACTPSTEALEATGYAQMELYACATLKERKEEKICLH